jgi:hypothetical protein
MVTNLLQIEIGLQMDCLSLTSSEVGQYHISHWIVETLQTTLQVTTISGPLHRGGVDAKYGRYPMTYHM